MKVFGFVGTDHLRTKIIVNDETSEQVNQLERRLAMNLQLNPNVTTIMS
jgi:hypothetical protein